MSSRPKHLFDLDGNLVEVKKWVSPRRPNNNNGEPSPTQMNLLKNNAKTVKQKAEQKLQAGSVKTDLLKLLEEAQALLDTGRNASSSSDASSGSSTRKKNISLDDFAREFNCKVVLERIDGHPSSSTTKNAKPTPTSGDGEPLSIGTKFPATINVADYPILPESINPGIKLVRVDDASFPGPNDRPEHVRGRVFRYYKQKIPILKATSKTD